MSDFDQGFIWGIIFYAVATTVWQLSVKLFGPTIRYLFVERWEK